MDEIVYSVMKKEWDILAYGSNEYWEKQTVIAVFRKMEDAKRYVEEDAGQYEADINWMGSNEYYGSYVQSGIAYGLHYIIERLSLL